MKRRQGLGSLLAGVCAYALIGLALISWMHMRWDRLIDAATLPIETLHQTQLHLLKACLHAERELHGSGASSVALVQAELDSALAETEQLLALSRTGRDPMLAASVQAHLALIRQARSELPHSLREPTLQATLDLRALELRADRSALAVEGALYAQVARAQEGQNQLAVLTLVVVGLLGVVLMTQLTLAQRQRERVLAALASSEGRLRAFASALPDTSFVLDASGRHVDVFGSGSEHLVTARQELIGRRLQDFFSPAQTTLFLDVIQRALAGNETVGCTYELQLQGRTHWFEARARAIAGQQRVVWISWDITARKKAEERLQRMAHFDLLTQLPNRALVMSRLERAIARAQRQQHNLAVLFIDLDNFKTVNDSLGHAAGDRLLTAVAEPLGRRTRRQDTLGRLGGDEFVLLLEQLHEAKEAAMVAHELLQLLQAPFTLGHGQEVYVQASIGISIFPDDASDAGELVRDADAAMYQAKKSGRNAYRYYTEALTSAAHARLAIDTRMRRAIENSEFELRYQPLYSLPERQLIGLEALVRLDQPGLPPLGPAQFIPLLEETGQIAALGEWVTREACRQGRAWLDEGLDFGRIAVNVSAVEVRRGGLAERVRTVLAASGLPPERLELEMTESGLMEQGERAEALLAELRQLGVHVAIDDFGTGYSSLAYLKRFAVDKLKIDRSFINDIASSTSDQQLVITMVTLGHNLGMTVLAEGVETEAQLDLLQGMGCNAVQGYWFSPPRPASDARRWLRPAQASAAAQT
jgi:diguanylate cyclase (GGDEF)-like protein/PAS domain S-box-containing protein